MGKAVRFLNGSQVARYSGSIKVPANGFVIAVQFKVGDQVSGTELGRAGTIFDLSPSTTANAANSMRLTSTLTLTGRDQNSNWLAGDTFQFGSSSVRRGFSPEWAERGTNLFPSSSSPFWVAGDSTGAGRVTWCWIVRQSPWWIMYVAQMPGGAPYEVERIYDNTWSGINNLGNNVPIYVGCNRDVSGPCLFALQRLGILSYVPTKQQMLRMTNGESPVTQIGAMAATDFWWDFDEASPGVVPDTVTSPQTGIAATRNAAATGGYAVYPSLDPPVVAEPVGIGIPTEAHLWALPRGAASALIPLDVVMDGAVGAGVVVQVRVRRKLDGVLVADWQNIKTAPGGAVFVSDPAAIPPTTSQAQGGLYEVEGRKVISGVAQASRGYCSTPFSIGGTFPLGGQSLQFHAGDTSSVGYAINGVTPNGLNSFLSTKWNVSTEPLAVTGCVDAGDGQCELIVTSNHGLREIAGRAVVVTNVGGVPGANGSFAYTVTGFNRVKLLGSTFSGAYTSGGTLYRCRRFYTLSNRDGQVSGGHALFGNAFSWLAGMPCAIANWAVGGVGIEYFYTDAQPGSAQMLTLVLEMSRLSGHVTMVPWLHGHGNLGQLTYFRDSGAWPNEVGGGKLKTLWDYIRARVLALQGQTARDRLGFGVAGFTCITGQTAIPPDTQHAYRRGMVEWGPRMVAAGEPNAFCTGEHHDYPPKDENSQGTPGSVTVDAFQQNAHENPRLYRVMIEREALGCAIYIKGTATNGWNSALGALITAVHKISSTQFDVKFALPQGATTLRGLAGPNGITGFLVSATTTFSTATVLGHSAAIIAPDTLRITLDAPVGAGVYPYFHHGYGAPGLNAVTPAYSICSKIASYTDQGGGVKRITVASNSVSPNLDGVGIRNGGYVYLTDLRGTELEQRGQRVIATRIDATNLDATLTLSGTVSWTSWNGGVLPWYGNPLCDNRFLHDNAISDDHYSPPAQATRGPVQAIDPPGGAQNYTVLITEAAAVTDALAPTNAAQNSIVEAITGTVSQLATNIIPAQVVTETVATAAVLAHTSVITEFLLSQITATAPLVVAGDLADGVSENVLLVDAQDYEGVMVDLLTESVALLDDHSVNPAWLELLLESISTAVQEAAVATFPVAVSEPVAVASNEAAAADLGASVSEVIHPVVSTADDLDNDFRPELRYGWTGLRHNRKGARP